MVSLRGTSTGASRDDIINAATAKTGAYYGTDCVAVSLSNERIEESFSDLSGHVERQVFAADWEGRIEHQWNKPTYGFPECRKCGVSDFRRNR